MWPDWAPAFVAIKGWGGSLKDVPWLWGVDDYPGLGIVVRSLAGALAEAEANANKRYATWQKQQQND